MAAVSATAGIRYRPAGAVPACCDPAAPAVVYIGADGVVFYEDATGTGAAALTAGTVGYVLEDADGTVLDSGVLTHSAGGDYSAALDGADTLGLAEDADVFLELTYADGAGNNDFRRLKFRAGYRGAD